VEYSYLFVEDGKPSEWVFAQAESSVDRPGTRAVATDIRPRATLGTAVAGE
jgi:hypothetical protein